MTALARCSLFLSPAHRDDASRAFRDRALPIFARHGLTDAGPCPRAKPPDIYSHLLAIDAPDQFAAAKQALRRDPDWRQVFGELAGLADPRRSPSLEIYQAPADRPKVVEMGRGTHQGLWHNYGVQDGLPASLVLHLHFDEARGHLWFTSLEGGITRYDGAHCHVYTTAEGLADNTIHEIVPDRQGRLWLACKRRGIICYDGETFTSYTVEDGLAGNDTRSIFEDRDGVLWIISWSNGVSAYDGETFKTYDSGNGLAGDKATRVVQDRHGDLWFATEDGGATRFDGTRFHYYAESEGLAGRQVTNFFRDRDGNLWFAVKGQGATRYDGEAFTRYGAEDGLTCDSILFFNQDGEGRVWVSDAKADPHYFDGRKFHRLTGDHKLTYALFIDRDDDLWFNQEGGGLARYDGRSFTSHTIESGLSHQQIQTLIEDDRRFLWAGTWGGGLSRYDGRYWQHFTSDVLPTNQTLRLMRNAGRVEAVRVDAQNNAWFGTWGGGLVRYDGSGLKNFTSDGEFPDEMIWTVYIDRAGHLWFGTFSSGVVRYDGANFTTYTPANGLAHHSVWSICQTRDGDMWFGTQGGGISRFDGANFTTYTTRDGLADDMIWSLVEDDAGHVWCSCFEAGVCRFDGEAFTNYATEDGLAHDNVWYMIKDSRGHIWFGTWGGGVSRFDGEAFTNYTTQDGLVDNNVRSIFEDRDGHIWFSTYGGGACKFDGQVFQTIAQKDGLIHNAVQHIDQAPDGAMWIATEAGVSRYRPATRPPAVRCTGVVADRRYAPGEDIAVASTQRLVAFEFQGASFTTAPDQLAYVYQLQGHDPQAQTAYQRRVEYRDLKPGDYTFRVQAVDRDLNYSEPTTVDLAITPDTQRDRIEALEAELSQPQGLEQFIGQSPALQQTLDQIHTVADTDVTVLILGETGTGKGLAARAIHALSGRADQPLIQLNCGAIPEGLVESELFGHEKGAFTGAVQRKIGRFELADGGTLFLDEIGDLPLASQQVLLHVLQDGTFQRVGGDQTLAVDVRVVAATNRDLRSAMRAGTFREDLYFRLSAFALHLPPLRQRLQDVPLLLHYFVEQSARHLNRPVPAINPQVLTYLQQYSWPGNVRELEHLAQHAVLVCKDHRIELGDISAREATPPTAGAEYPLPSAAETAIAPLEEQERQLIERALDACNGIVYGERGAAQLLDIHPERLRAKMRKYGLKKNRRTAKK